MKLQCACGAKYAFEATPEMLQNPVKFVCPTCGLDSSEFINELIRKEFGAPEPAYTPPTSTPPPAAPAPAPRLRISHTEPQSAPPTAAESTPITKHCQRHRGELAQEKCVVCQTPICPKCMESFGYFCSPLCRNKADLQGIEAPVYAGQKFQMERAFWKKTGLYAGLAALGVLGLLGVWFWYAWIGSVPHNYFAQRFGDDERAYAGKSVTVGKDQLIYLHGGTLGRIDLKKKATVWQVELIPKAMVAKALKAEQDGIAKAAAEGEHFHHQSDTDLEREIKISLQHNLQLRVAGQNIWVGHGDKLTQYDWATGQAGKDITLPNDGGELVEANGELQMIGPDFVTHLSLTSGESHTDQFKDPQALALVSKTGTAPAPAGGLFSADGKPLDPNKVANQAQNLKLPGRIALPALIGNTQHESQLEKALADDPNEPNKRKGVNLVGRQFFDLVAGETGFVQFSRTLLEERIIQRDAMKAAPKKSALDGDVNMAHTADIVNEQLNEMQRNNGGGTVEENQSRYQVTVHLPDSANTPDWTAEVVGPPALYVLKTVNVVAAGKTVIVLDKSNKQLWQASLTYPMEEINGLERLFQRNSGEGPCVEHGDTLYVYDQAILSAFNLASGDARWRVPSVGVSGLFFDDQGNVFVNTTSRSLDDIKYARQIDIGKQTDDVLMKLEPKTGKTLWTVKPGGVISYLHGKFIYTIQSFDPNPTDEEENDMTSGLSKPAYLRIARIDPKSGRLLWEHYQDRCPVDVNFTDNSIQLIFKREVQVLRYLTF